MMNFIGKQHAISNREIPPIQRCERLSGWAVLPAVPELTARYRNGGEWLERRLDDLAAGRARVWGVCHGHCLAAIAIETPKGPHLRKLSTFGVAPLWRSLGIGTALLDATRRIWLAEDVDRVHVTVDHTDLQTRGFFLRNGFIEELGALVDYGSERRDCLLTWSRSLDPLAVTAVH